MLFPRGFTLPVVRSLLNSVHSGTEPWEVLKNKVREQLAQIVQLFIALEENHKPLHTFLNVQLGRLGRSPKSKNPAIGWGL